MLLSQKPTGVVLIGGQLRDPAATLPVALAVQRMSEQGVPVVAVGRYELDIPHVTVDDVAAAECAVSHLTGLGHRRIAFLGGPLNSTTVQDRYSGYGAALMRIGEPLDERLVVQTPLTLEGGAQAITRLVAAGAPFTAVFCATDEVAFGAMPALRELGLRVPTDVSVAGFNDVVMSAHSDPPLTTIHVPARDLGLAAWHLLVSDRPRAARGIGEYLPFKLVKRSSTAPPSHGPSVGHAAIGEGDGASRPSAVAADSADTGHEDGK
jgi:LacI family repressor for deo operon, udp, cdd, tsx, nupC, and nupG